MRLGAVPIWNAWSNAGLMAGDQKSHGRVTVEPDWKLKISSVPWSRGPARSWISNDHSIATHEVEVPNIKSIQMNRTVNSDAGECTIAIYNQKMNTNTDPDLHAPLVPVDLGKPGYYGFTRGDAPLSNARWGQSVNEWSHVLMPNCLLRTYQGYGGNDLSIQAAVTAGNLLLTGVWLADEVNEGTDGTIAIHCRDIAKLLIDQWALPPLIPTSLYPVQYCHQFRSDAVVATGGGTNDASGSSPGHPKEHAFEHDPNSYWLSEPHGSVNESPAPYVEFINNGPCDKIVFLPWAGHYQVFVSLRDRITQEWQGTPNPFGGLPILVQAGVPFEQNVAIPLGKTYDADLIRLTFTNLYSGNNVAPFFAGVREYEAERTSIEGGPAIRGNYADYTDIVKELLLWAGWHLDGESTPTVYGNMETTGAYYNDDCLPIDLVDKKPVIDGINAVRDVVGYQFWIDPEGAARFETANWYSVGNWTEDGTRTNFVPDIDESVQLTEYTMRSTDKDARSEIIVSTDDPWPIDASTVTIRYTPVPTPFSGIITRQTPDTAVVLRGMVKPAMWVNGLWLRMGEEQIYMVEQIAQRILWSMRQGSVSCLGNPAIDLGDQVRIYERNSSDSFIHYVRGISSDHDLDTGSYITTITTNWLGENGDLPARPVLPRKHA